MSRAPFVGGSRLPAHSDGDLDRIPRRSVATDNPLDSSDTLACHEGDGGAEAWGRTLLPAAVFCHIKSALLAESLPDGAARTGIGCTNGIDFTDTLRYTTSGVDISAFLTPSRVH